MKRLWSTQFPGEACIVANQLATRMKKKVAKMVTVMVLAFVLCWTPLQSLLLYVNFSTREAVGRLSHTNVDTNCNP